MKKRTILILLALVVVVGSMSGFFYLKNRNNNNEERRQRPPISKLDPGVVKYANAQGDEWTIPEGEYQFKVASAEVYPKIVTGIISPLDVKVGDTQKMMIAVNGDSLVSRVWAEIETDNSIRKVELTLSTTTIVSAADRLKEPYLVDEKGYLVINNGRNNFTIQNLIKIAEAKAPVTQYIYEGSWKVEDTHTKTYHTKFIAQDSVKRENSYLIAWSDPNCNFDFAGNLITASCNPAAGEVIGFDGANAVLNGNTVILTGTGSMFAFNGGASGSIQIGTGAIGTTVNPISSVASIKQTNMYYSDIDGDTRVSNVQVYENTTASWASHIRVKDVANKGTGGANYQTPSATYNDCDDYNANTYPGQTSYFSTPIVDTGGTSANNGTYDYNCDGVSANSSLTQDYQYTHMFGKGFIISNNSYYHSPSYCLWTPYSTCIVNDDTVTGYFTNYTLGGDGWVIDWYHGSISPDWNEMSPLPSSAPVCWNNHNSKTYIVPVNCAAIGNATACNSAGITTRVQACR
ncbi:MAG: hypothetical protein WCW78_00850 [Candidatus Paceibacterota bacterium]